MFRSIKRVGLATALGALLLAPLVPSPAQAALTVAVINTDGQGVASRYAPQISATNGYGAPAGASLVANCWTRGDAVGPNNNTLWWSVAYAGRQFYVADRYLSTPYIASSTPSEPTCGSVPPPPPPTSDAPPIWVGSPIQGTWDLPTSQGGDGAAAHHWLSNARDQGDFAIDLIAGAGQQVVLYAAPQSPGVAISAKVDQVGASCRNGGGGSFVTVGFYSSAQRIGSATYAHIKPSVSVGQSLNRWGTVVGTVGSGYARSADCWTGPHVHMQLFSDRHYACFNKGFRLGQAINRTNFVGFTGGAVAMGPRQRCS
ncbi:MAG: M23 family metallopeptidase [Nocardioides sp.]|uniref:M23 family metallopeptidase n=1 Tax=Nocardioides sp. TaxID=35761 RepID=UPI00326401C9